MCVCASLKEQCQLPSLLLLVCLLLLCLVFLFKAILSIWGIETDILLEMSHNGASFSAAGPQFTQESLTAGFTVLFFKDQIYFPPDCQTEAIKQNRSYLKEDCRFFHLLKICSIFWKNKYSEDENYMPHCTLD